MNEEEVFREKLIKKLSKEYNFEAIKSLGMYYYTINGQPLVNKNFYKMCCQYNIDISKMLHDLNIPMAIYEVSVSYFFVAKDGNKNILAEYKVYGVPQFENCLEYELNIIHEYEQLADLKSYYHIIGDETNKSYKVIDLITKNHNGNKLFEIVLLNKEKVIYYIKFINNDVYKNETKLKGKIASSMKEELEKVISYEDKSVYVWMRDARYFEAYKKIYTDKKQIKNVLVLDNQFDGADDFIDTLNCLSLLITFDDNTKRLLLVDITTETVKKHISRYFNNLNFIKAFVSMLGGYCKEDKQWQYYPTTGLTFNYNLDNEIGEYIVTESGEKLLLRKRKFQRR